MVSSEDLAEAVHFYDSQGDGKISLPQVGLCLRAIGLAPTEAQISTLTASFPRDGRVGVAELVPIARELSNKSNVDISLCLTPFDRDCTGFISIAELRHVLQNCGEKLSSTDVDILLQGVDVADGKVNIPLFVKHISSL